MRDCYGTASSAAAFKRCFRVYLVSGKNLMGEVSQTALCSNEVAGLRKTRFETSVFIPMGVSSCLWGLIQGLFPRVRQATVNLLSPNICQELNLFYEIFSTFCPYFTRDAQLFPQSELGTAVFRFLAGHF